MEYFIGVVPKLESESLLTCKFCLAAEGDVRLTRRNLTLFYNTFRVCGIGLNIMEPEHYNWTCQFCWRRATQCVKFIQCARDTEQVLNHELKNEEVTHDKLFKVCKNFTRPVELSPCVIQTNEITYENYIATPKVAVTLSNYDNNPLASRHGGCDFESHPSKNIYSQNDTKPTNHILFYTRQVTAAQSDTIVDIPKNNIIFTPDDPAHPVFSTTDLAHTSDVISDIDVDHGTFTTVNAGIPHKFLQAESLVDSTDTAVVSEMDLHDDDETLVVLKMRKYRDVGHSETARSKKSTRTRAKSKETKSKLPRKDPVQLVEKWKRLQVEVINLTEEQQRAEIEQRRRTDKYAAWKYRCDKCAVGYHEEECIEKHNEMHSESRGAYVCPVCEVRFAKPHQLSSHAANHRRRWRCLRCGEVILKSAYLAPHHAKCTDSAPVTCNLCGKLFSNTLHLRKHISKSHNVCRKYVCDICARVFKEKLQIKHHMRIHTGETPFTCSECGKKSSTITSHRLHMLVHKEETRSPETYCVECNRYFKNKYILRKHFKQSQKHVSKETFQHSCTECPERFVRPRALRIHMNAAHLNNRTHPCKLCDKAYFTQGALTVHLREKHTAGAQSKSFMCSVCERGFVSNGQLKQHMRTHTKERPYACLICPATFGFNSALYTHNKLKHKMTTAELHKKLKIPKQSVM